MSLSPVKNESAHGVPFTAWLIESEISFSRSPIG
jgi:hypothetical protein